MPRNHWLSRLLFQGRQFKSRRRSRRLCRIEALEDRTLLATITVTTNLDIVNQGDGVTSLREAVNIANLNPGPDTIVIDPSLDGFTMKLNSEIGIPSEITIQGNGANKTVIDPQLVSRAFVIYSAGKFNLDGVQIINGNAATGGAIRNAGTTVISNSEILQNHASDSGGGIFNVAKLTVVNSLIASNGAANDGGGIAQNHSNGNLRILNSTLSDNSANSSGGGLVNLLGRASLVNSTIVRNYVNPGQGGAGIYAFSDVGTVTSINNSIVAGNYLLGSFEPNDAVLTTDGINSSGTFQIANSWANLIGNAGTAGGLSKASNSTSWGSTVPVPVRSIRSST